MMWRSLVLAAALLIPLPTLDVAFAADRFVSAKGNDTANNCLASATPCRSVATAIAQSTSGDMIKITAGKYLENLVINFTTTLTMSGAWAADFSGRDLTHNVTKIDGHKLAPVFQLHANTGQTLDVTIDGVTITNGSGLDTNVAGGIVARTDSNGSLAVHLNDVTITKNHGGTIGGGLTCFATASSSLTFIGTNLTVTKNTTVGQGGGFMIFAAAGSPAVSTVLSNTLFAKNKARIFGGAIYALSRDTSNVGLSIDGSQIQGNKASGQGGGGISVDSSDTTTLTLSVSDTAITKNKAPAGGAVLATAELNGDLAASFSNTIIAQNTGSGTGSALHGSVSGASTLTVDLINSTVTRNNAIGTIAIYSADTAAWTTNFRNTILFGNGNKCEFQGVQSSSGSRVLNADHNDVDGGPVSNLGFCAGGATVNDLGGNINAAPLFASSKDLHLTAASPDIDAGTCTGAPGTDLSGNPRPTGAACDIGAYEFQP